MCIYFSCYFYVDYLGLLYYIFMLYSRYYIGVHTSSSDFHYLIFMLIMNFLSDYIIVKFI